MGKIKRQIKLMKTPAGALRQILGEIRERARARTDICDHLETLFLECLPMAPRLMVELGVGDGESTFVLERVARMWDAVLVSVDIEDRQDVSSYRRRFFVHQDDVAFGRDFPSWCASRGILPEVDLLFVDTSHLYDHTVQEIAAWFPHLAEGAKAIFHDTHMTPQFVRKDGSTGLGWDNERGVIRAIEESLACRFDEEADFVRLCGEWLVRHQAHCNGFTVLERYGP